MTGSRRNTVLVLGALFSHWRRHNLQLITLVLGLASATALWTAVQALNSHARTSYDRAAGTIATFDRAFLGRPDRSPFDERAFADLRRAGILVAPLVEGRFGPPNAGVLLTGFDPLSFDAAGSGTIEVPQGADMLDFLEPPGLLYADAETGERLRSLLAALPGDKRPLVTLRTTIAPGQAVGDITTVQRVLGREGMLSKLLLPADGLANGSDIPEPWRSELVPLEPPVQVDLKGLTDSFHLNLTAFGLLCFLVGLFIVYSAIGLAVEDRLAALRTLRICGVSRRQLLLLLITEMLTIAVFAGAGGILGGYAIAAALLPDVAASLRGLYGARVGGTLALDANWWVGGLAVSLLGAFGSAIGAFIKISNMSLLEARGSAAWRSKQGRSVRFLAIFATFFAILATVLHWFADGLLAGFLIMAGILLAGAFALPPLLLLVLRLGRRYARAPLAQWFWADSRQQLSGLSLALMALLLALGANVGVSGMVEGFRQTFDAFLEERLSADLYVLGISNDEASNIIGWAQEQQDVSAILPIWDAKTTVGGEPVNVVGFDDHPSYRSTWTLLERAVDPWQQTLSGRGVLINEQLFYRSNLEVGDVIAMTTDSGTVSRTVVGVYSDYGNPRSEVRLPNPALERHWPSGERRRVALHATVDPMLLAGRLEADVGIPQDRMVNQAGLKGFSRSVFERTFAVSRALNTLTLGVAGIALVTSLLTLASARLTGVAPIWAMGVRRQTITRLEGVRIVFLAVLTAIAAVPLGVAISWCLVAVINVEAFGWRLPLHVFPEQWLVLALLGVATAFAASLYPLMKMQRTPPAELAKVFAHEH